MPVDASTDYCLRSDWHGIASFLVLFCALYCAVLNDSEIFFFLGGGNFKSGDFV